MINFKEKIKKGGFTLIEMMVAVSIFSLIMSMGIGAVLSMLNYTKTTRAMSSVMNDLNITLDSITREIRFGVNYYCSNVDSDTGNSQSTRECPEVGDNYIFFTETEERERIGYGFDEDLGSIVRIDSAKGQKQISAGEIIIEDMKFYVSSGGDSLNPRSKVLIVVKGILRDDPSSRFNLQTTVGQRGIY